MIKLSRMADYGVVLMSQLACAPGRVQTAPQLARSCGLPLPTVSKLLKLLAQGGLLTSQRGTKGGYRLARGASAITVGDVIGALDGPIALTDCAAPDGLECGIEALCPTRTGWLRINDAMVDALNGVTLADMAVPAASALGAAPPAAAADALSHQGA